MQPPFLRASLKIHALYLDVDVGGPRRRLDGLVWRLFGVCALSGWAVGRDWGWAVLDDTVSDRNGQWEPPVAPDALALPVMAHESVPYCPVVSSEPRTATGRVAAQTSRPSGSSTPYT